jgi:predicted alpha/beta superfamily hydrolase
MKLIASAATLLLATIFAVPASAQPEKPFLPIAAHDLQSAEGLTYRIIVAPPAGPAPAAGYPVIYVVDGNAWAPMMSEVIRTNLDFGLRSKVEPAVVVGIGYPIDGGFDMKRRLHDLTTPSNLPRPVTNVIPIEGGGYEKMIRFVQERVKPDIEKRFRIDRARQALAGHSLGGLFTLRTLMNHPDWFQTYLAFSPSIWWHDAALIKEALSLSPSPAQRTARVYIGIGELEEYKTADYEAENEATARERLAADPKALGEGGVKAYMANFHNRQNHMVDNARDMANILTDKGLKVRYDQFPEEDHFSVLPSQIGRAIPYALSK